MEAIQFESDLFSFEKPSNDHSEYWFQTIPDFFKAKKIEDIFSFLLLILKFFKFRSPLFLRKKILKRQERRMRKGMRRIDARD